MSTGAEVFFAAAALLGVWLSIESEAFLECKDLLLFIKELGLDSIAYEETKQKVSDLKGALVTYSDLVELGLLFIDR